MLGQEISSLFQLFVTGEMLWADFLILDCLTKGENSARANIRR
jgi:hypothetical protein